MIPDTESLLAYAPSLASEFGGASGPSFRTIPAAVLSADISGFTPLAERLGQHADGAERLSEILNEYFSVAIDFVYRHGGDIIEFAGDSVFALWRADVEPAAAAVLRATQCGNELARVLGGHASAIDSRVSTRLYVSAGNALVAPIDSIRGGSTLYVGGEPFSQIRALADRGVSGQVVVSDTAWKLISARTSGHALPGGGVRLAAITDPIEPRELPRGYGSPGALTSAARFVPAVVRERGMRRSGEWMAEIRKTTVVFFQIDGLVLGDPSAATRINDAARVFRDALEAYEGNSYGVEEDDKGTVLVATFGVHPFAHEDDAARAVLAAYSIRRTLGQQGLSTRVGIATGRVFSGPVGNEKRRHHIVCGSVVNLAARLMEIAQSGSITCDTDTRGAASPRVDFGRLPLAQLKGIDQPARIFRAIEERSPSLTSELLGRERELDLIRRRFERWCRDRIGGIVVVQGEPGIGKTALLQWSIRQAEAIGAECLEGAGDSIIRSEPYFAWGPIFRTVVQGPDHESADSRRAASARERADAVAASLVRALAARSASAPQLIVLDDTQWFDSGSWGLLSEVVRRASTCLVIIAFRSAEVDPPVELRALLDQPEAMHLDLQPLKPREVTEIVNASLGSSDVSSPIVQFVANRSDGNPLFVSEIAFALRDLGLVKLEGGRCVLSVPERQLHVAPLPPTVEGIITSRITRLTPQHQLLAKMGSVIGIQFSVDALCALDPGHLDAADVAIELERLVDSGVLVRDRGRHGWYAFRHSLFAEVAYGLMLDAQRRSLHGLVAQWYEERSGDDPALHASNLAHHWSRSATPSRARGYLELAADRAKAEFANDEAATLLGQALELGDPAPPPYERAMLELHLGQAFVGLLRYAEGRQHVEAGLRLLGDRVPGTGVAQAAALATEILKWAVRRRIRARSTTDSTSKETAARSQAYVRLAEVYYFANQNLLSVRAAFRALNLARTVGSSSELAESYATVGPLLGFVGLKGLANSYLTRASSLAEQLADGPATTFVGLSAGYYHTGMGNWSEARRYLTETATQARSMGDWRRHADALGNLMAILWLRGENEECKRMATQILGEATRRENARYQVEAQQALAYCHLDEGDLAAAGRALAAARRLTGSDLGSTAEGLGLELDGLTCMLLIRSGPGNYNEAKDAATRLNERARRSSPNYYGALTGYSAPAAVGLALWRDSFKAEEARRLAKAGLDTMKRYVAVFHIGRPRQLLLQAAYEELSGRPALAARLRERGLSNAASLGMTPEPRFNTALTE